MVVDYSHLKKKQLNPVKIGSSNKLIYSKFSKLKCNPNSNNSKQREPKQFKKINVNFLSIKSCSKKQRDRNQRKSVLECLIQDKASRCTIINR